jgi:hypothetical protein
VNGKHRTRAGIGRWWLLPRRRVNWPEAYAYIQARELFTGIGERFTGIDFMLIGHLWTS